MMNLRSEMEGCCMLCYKPLENRSQSVVVDDSILELCTFLISQLDIYALRGSPICVNCLTKLHEAYNFKSVQLLNSNWDFQGTDEPASDGSYMCHICRNVVGKYTCSPFMLLLEENDLKDTIRYLISERLQEFLIAGKPMACYDCQNTVLHISDVVILLSIYEQRLQIYSDELKEDIFKMPDNETVNQFNLNNEIDSLAMNLDCVMPLIPSKNSNFEMMTDFMEPVPSTSKDVPEALPFAGVNSFDTFMSKNEDVDLKMELDEGFNFTVVGEILPDNDKTPEISIRFRSLLQGILKFGVWRILNELHSTHFIFG